MVFKILAVDDADFKLHPDVVVPPALVTSVRPSGGDDTAAIQAAASALPEGGGVVRLAPGTYQVSAAVTLNSGAAIIGAGANATSINASHAGAVFVSATPGTRTYSWVMQGFTIDGPGSGTAGSIGIDLASVSTSHVTDVTVKNIETCFRVRSTINGGAVYNRFTNVTALLAITGFDIAASGSNATTLDRSRANLCTTGIAITDSNECLVQGSQIEACTTGVSVTATSVALSDACSAINCRFEGNTTAWNVTSANVRDFTVGNPRIFGTYTISDSGVRTNHFGVNTGQGNKAASAFATVNGSWRFDRSANGGTELPAMVVRDSATSSGTPVTIQAETERLTGYFLRGVRGGVNYFDVGATDGSIRLPQAGYVELMERAADPAAPAANGGRVYLKDNGAGKTQLCVRFATGAVQVVATEP